MKVVLINSPKDTKHLDSRGGEIATFGGFHKWWYLHKSSCLKGFSLINQAYGGTPMTMETPYETAIWRQHLLCRENLRRWEVRVGPEMDLHRVASRSKKRLPHRRFQPLGGSEKVEVTAPSPEKSEAGHETSHQDAEAHGRHISCRSFFPEWATMFAMSFQIHQSSLRLGNVETSCSTYLVEQSGSHRF